jgi:hypothetical protein
MSGPRRFVRNPAVTETAVGDEIFLVEPDDQEVFYLNEITSALWRFLSEARDRSEIEAVFEEAFPDTDADEIAEDLDDAIQDMHYRGLIVSVP